MRCEVEFYEDGLVARIARVSRDILRRAGAYVRRVAQRKVVTSPKPSTPGQPPHSRRGLLKRAILFGSDGNKSVLVGPGFNLVGPSMSAHEFGGKYMRERYPKRPLMGPALKESAPHVAKMWKDAVMTYTQTGEKIMAYKLGLDAQLFHGAAGATATSEMKNCKDVTLNLETGEADITTRAAEGWRITAATLKDVSLEFEMVWDTADAGFKAIKNAYFNNTAIALFASDGDGNGLDADFVVTSFSRSEPLEEALTVSVTCKPTLVTRPPTWKDGGGNGG